MTRLIAAACLAALALARTAHGEGLDFPSDPAAEYSITDVNQYACLRESVIRLVYVEYYETAGAPPCGVVYEKSPPEEMSKDVLWRSDYEKGFCEERARQLVEDLRAGGWKCGLYRDVLGIGN